MCAVAGKRIDVDRAERAVAELVAALGLSQAEEMADTARLVAQALPELCRGLEETLDPLTTMPGPDLPVSLEGIRFYSLCEHHLLPFFGTARIAYLPAGRLAGLGDIARLVDHLARRPTIQERLTQDLATRLQAELGAQGVAVELEATHLCIAMRGPAQTESRLRTSCRLGELGSWPGWQG